MASTTALLSGLSGLNANARRLEVIGNNIANVNVTAFKSSRLMLSNTVSRTFSLGGVPNAVSGGTNPGQVGLGVTISGTQRDMTNGSIANTGVPTDLAIEGGGFFILSRNGDTSYTRAGSFQLNASNQLLTQTGERVQGYTVDKDYNLVAGKLTDVTVPLGSMTVAQATKNVNLSGNLRADGTPATTGSTFTFAALSAGGPITSTSLLTAITPGGFAVGDTITLSGATKGSKTLPDKTFTVGAASTIDDYMQFLQTAMGVVKDGGYNSVTDPAPEPGGYTIDPLGVITFTGNFGKDNDLNFGDTDFTVKDSTGAPKTSPFTATKTASANGESVATSFIVYDSLGSALTVDATMVLARTDSTGTYWRAFMDSADDTDGAIHLETGDRAAGTSSDAVPLVKFDNFGTLVSGSKISFELDRKGTGAADPMTVSLSFDSGADKVTGLANTGGESTIASKYQDGSPMGTLNTFSVGDDGTITGGFSNGLTRTIGQVALANFDNPQGLVDVGNNQFKTGPNSGNAVVTSPGKFGTGKIVGGALEQSNVDLAQQFIEMIQTTTGYSASSRVITTADQLLQQLIATAR